MIFLSVLLWYIYADFWYAFWLSGLHLFTNCFSHQRKTTLDVHWNFVLLKDPASWKLLLQMLNKNLFSLFNRCILHAIFICLHCTRSYLILTINFLEIFILFCFFIYHHWSKYYFIIFFFIYHHWSKYCTVIKLN